MNFHLDLSWNTKKCTECKSTLRIQCESFNRDDECPVRRSFLYAHRALPERVSCPNCHIPLHFKLEEGLFTCDYREECSFSFYERSGTWFSGTNMTLRKCTLLVTIFCMSNVDVAFISLWCNLPIASALRWMNYCREVCYHHIKRQSEILGGPGIIVDIDEAKPAKQMYNRALVIGGQWVFAGVERKSRKTFIVDVSCEGADGLLQAIEKYIRPGTIIVSDRWGTYTYLGEQKFSPVGKRTRGEILDPFTGVLVPNIEMLNWDIHSLQPRFIDHKPHTHGYLGEALFKMKYEYPSSVHYMWQAIGDLYPGPNGKLVKHEEDHLSSEPNEEEDNW